jgi:cytochrome c
LIRRTASKRSPIAATRTRVRTADGKTQEFWERNLRLKTDSSDEGPRKGAPATVAAGMMGDRASLIFATPGEISASIKQQCQ